MTLSPEAIKKISEIKLISIESIFEKELQGLLYSSNLGLRYFNFETKTSVTISPNDYCFAICHDPISRKTYLREKNYIKILGLQNVFTRSADTTSIIKHRLVLDAGWYGLMETETSKVLISETDMNKKDINCFKSLRSYRDQLYALMTKEEDHLVVKINIDEKNNYSIGETIHEYKNTLISSCDFEIIPYGHITDEKGKINDFSIVSCLNSDTLDLNGEIISGSELTGGHIDEVHLIDSKSTTADVIYAISKGGMIKSATIDLEQKTATTNTIMADKDCMHIFALEPIFNKNSHKMILEMNQHE
ncbi:MAG: hypothetical protein ABIC91_01155 [Nanoarchaeota archaeon]|nr:hypothetical protein [Nanoarchaeota archaeon]MBU1030413.1 hypothetical protein [Nanoarchaeota archaeon]MBU1850587.1 hypothetical protein [Nanoarchaeota archaeon]